MNPLDLKSVQNTKLSRPPSCTYDQTQAFCYSQEASANLNVPRIKGTLIIKLLICIKSLDIHHTIVRQIVYKWRHLSAVAVLSRSGCPAKMTPKAVCCILKGQKKKLRVTAKGLKELLQLLYISYHGCTTCKLLKRHDVWV